MELRPRHLIMIILIIAIITGALIVMITVNASLGQSYVMPFKTITTKSALIEYYGGSVTGHPALVIHVYMNGQPIEVTVSLFAFTPRHIYTIGYYKGLGTVSISLDNPLIMRIASDWYGNYSDAIWPSLIAFITYTNDTPEVYMKVVTIPYPPSYLSLNKPLTIVVNTNITKNDLMIPELINSIKDPSAGGGSPPPKGFTYIGNCNGNGVVRNNPPGPGAWILANCLEYEGSWPQFFIGWSENVLTKSGISGISFTVNDYIESGSGPYGVLNRTAYCIPTGTWGSSYLELVGPLFEFSNNMNIELWNGYTSIEAEPDASLSPGTANGFLSGDVITYQVNGPGFVYTYFDSYIAFVSFYYKTGNYIFWTNGTYILGFGSNTMPSGDTNTLYLMPGIDMGNGPITSMFVNMNYFGYEPSIYDGYEVIGAGAIPLCSNEPSITTGTGGVTFTLSSLITTYNPNPVGIAFALSLLLDPWDAMPNLFASLTRLFIPPVTASTYYTQTQVMIGASNTQLGIYRLYITFIGTNAAQNNGNEYYWPMGIILNYSSPYTGQTLCNG
ncbi:hypothetical protein VMUT_2091 [Vulcanisaeta moutnovskia 768-28]|uniref:Uncharacterized protein n=2 Tax=Vulcanisaeta TaxID=164450 RepID=F0QWS1_VULM7|nr:hypothetical protein VMUT_2091 [Vulcanisaeta moutnovskia 768-28]